MLRAFDCAEHIGAHMEQTAVDTTYLKRCIRTLERTLAKLGGHDGDDVLYDMYRTACVKEFELVLEQSGKLLKKRLRPWFASNRQADRLTFNYLAALRDELLPKLVSGQVRCRSWVENEEVIDG